MAVRFIIGRAGSGKTHRCLEEITAACAADPLGPPIIYLVPEQASYLAEKSLLEFGPVDGYTRAQVLSFTRLAEYVYARSPASGLPRLSNNHRALIATLLVAWRRGDGAQGLLLTPGIEEAILDFISEAKQYTASADRLRAVAESLRRSHEKNPSRIAPLLDAKLQTLAALLDDYHKFIADRFEDPQDTLTNLHDQILGGNLFQSAEIYIDGFIDFTPAEEKVLLSLAGKARRMTIAMLGDPDSTRRWMDGSPQAPSRLFRTTEQTFQHLASLLSENQVETEPVVYTEAEPGRFHAPDIQYIEQDFLKPLAGEPRSPENIEFSQAENVQQEARLAVERIARWRAERGWDYGEIAIMARSLEEYAAPLEDAFRTLRIPHYIDQALPLETHPLVLGIQSLIRAALYPSQTDYLLQLGKSGFLPVEREHADLLENHVLQYPRTRADWYSPDPWPTHPSRSPMDEDEARAQSEQFPPEVEEARLRIAKTVERFRNAYTKESQKEGRLRDFLESLARVIDGVVGEQSWEPEDESILGRIGQLLGEEAEVAGDEVVSWELAGDLTIRALGALGLPRIPPMLGEVFVGEAGRSRQPPARAVILLGLAEGVFPRVTTNASLLNDNEREELEGLGLELRPTSKVRFERESLFAYRVLSAASHALLLSYPRVLADGSTAYPSTYWNDLARKFGIDTPRHELPDDDPSRSWRARELASSALRRLDRTHEEGPDALAAGPFAWAALKNRTLLDEARAVRQAAAWKNEARLDPESLERFYKKRLTASASQLDSFGKCPFQHYVRYLLRPQEAVQPELSDSDAGLFCHAVLRNLTSALREKDMLRHDVTEDQLRPIFDQAVAGPRGRMDRAGLTSQPSGRMLIDRVTETLWDVARWIIESLSTLPFKPAYEEALFRDSKEAQYGPLEVAGLPDGWEFLIRGQVDRIDTLAFRGRELAVAVDYKLRRKKFHFDYWDSGENFQLPLYLLSIRSSQGLGLSPAGGVYLGLMPEEVKGKEKPRRYEGIFDASILAATMGAGEKGNPWTRLAYIQGSSGDPFEEPRGSGTAITAQQLESLLIKTEEKLVEAGRRIISGDAAVAPARHGKQTACSYCSYGAICGVDYRLNRAVLKQSPGRREILARLEENA